MSEPESDDPKERWERIKSILEKTLEARPGDRERLLEECCGDDTDLRAELEELLAAHDAVGSEEFFGVAESRAETRSLPGGSRSEPETIGPYRILRPIASGGMGIVYLAEQSAPIRRRVAIKLIHGGINTREIVARFDLERQALALMAHPGIAQVLDAGATDQGRPYFVMEYVPGVPITDFCESHDIDLRGRLELFARVCDAIQHAHQKGIVHRDIKPSNVLAMDRESEQAVKVIDFGVAKAMGSPLARPMVETRTRQILGTPDYLSPEQAAPREGGVDTRTDVYALGVLLYELLTGHLPFGRMGAGDTPLDEVLRRIRLEEPPRPSVRVEKMEVEGPGGVASRSSTTRSLARTLRGDLDWIILKALEKDKDRRYASASALKEDIERYLSSQPVLARPPSAIYQLRKFALRNRALMGGLVATATVLLAAAAISTVFGLREARARQQAERISYVANISAAEASLRLYDLAEVRRRLDDCPPELRGWEWRHLFYRSEMSRQIIRGHTWRIYAVAASADGRFLASGSVDPENEIFIWSAETGALLRRLSGHVPGEGGRAGIRGLAFSPDSRVLVSGSDDTTVRLWDAVEGRPLNVLRGHESRVSGVTFTPDGREVVSASWDGTVRRWDAGTGESLGTLSTSVRSPDEPNKHVILPGGGEGAVGKSQALSVASCGNGVRIHSGHADGVVRIWERSSSRLLESIDLGATIHGLSCGPEGDLLAAGLQDGHVVIMDARDGSEVRRLTGHRDGVYGVNFSASGESVVSVGGDRTVRLWDAESGRLVSTLLGHDDYTTAVTFDADGERVVSASADRTLRIWDADPAHLSSLFRALAPGPVSTMAIQTEANRLILASYEDPPAGRGGFGANTLQVLDLSTGLGLDTLRAEFPWATAISRDGQRIAGARAEDVQIWQIGAEGRLTLAATLPVEGITVMAFVPGTSRILLARDLEIEQWDFQEGKMVSRFEIGRDISVPPRSMPLYVWRMVVARGGERAAVSVRNYVYLVNLATSQIVAEAVTGHIDPSASSDSPINRMAFSPDGELLATAHAQDYTVRLWHGRTLRAIATGQGHAEIVVDIEFSRDGTRIATVGGDHSLRLWDGRTGEPLLALRTSPSASPTRAVFLPDDGEILTVGRDRSITRWRTRIGSTAGSRPLAESRPGE